jgi:phospholipid/cholesterol/gamma-HCH transport system ATP-binding protein
MIRVKNLWKSYGKHPVLRGINIEIEKGKTMVILGRSGSGKSVLLRHIMGLEEADTGTIEINDRNLAALHEEERYAVMRNMGMLFQASALFDSLNLEQNTTFYLDQHEKQMSREEKIDRAMKALAMVGLEEARFKMPADLSGGMRKRAALARLIVYRPKYILYDEPTTGLDPITAMHINDLILKTQQELNATSIVVTHDLCSAFHVADQIALNHEGRILYITTKEEFVTLKDPIVEAFLKNSIPEGTWKR